MASIYKIDNTSGTLTITIHPGRANGPGQKDQDSDLYLFGMGSLQWGQGVDKNIFRLLENFSCPQKDPSDAQPPGTAGKVWPKGPDDSYLIGEFDPSKEYSGISEPVTGQVWYNTTVNKAYIFDQSGDSGDGSWFALGGASIGTDPPGQSSKGDFWFDTGDGICQQGQLMIYDPDHCESVEINKNGWVSASQNYIARCGITSVCGELRFDDAGCPTDAHDPNCTNPGKIVGAILQDCTLVQTVDPADPAGAPASKREVHKYAFPEGTRMMFAQPCAPAGWTVDTDTALNGRYLQVVSIADGNIGNGGDYGGNLNHNPHEMTASQVPAHTHTGSASSAGNHTHTGYAYAAGNHRHYAATNAAGNHTHTTSTSTGGNHAHSYLRSNKHVGFTGSYCCALAHTQVYNSTTYSGSHNHYIYMNGAGNHAHAFYTNYGGNHAHNVTVYSGGAHTHSVSVTASNGPVKWEPKYYNAVVCVKLEDDGVFEGNSQGTTGNAPAGYCS